MTFSARALDVYGKIVGDTNPAHECGNKAIVHAGLLMGLACAEAAKRRPGWVCALVEMKFLCPFTVNEEVVVDVSEIARVVGGLSVSVELEGRASGLARAEILMMPPR